jgi:WD40 repeat protein
LEDLDNAVYLWSTDTGRLIGTCAGHKQPVVAVAFAPDGLTLASSGTDSTIKFWNLATRQELLSIQRPGSTLANLVFSADGRYLVGTAGWPMPSTEYRFFSAPLFSKTDTRR